MAKTQMTVSRLCGGNTGRWLVRLTLIALSFTGGCAAVPPAPSPAAVVAKHTESFNSGSMDAKQAWDLATVAINAGDWDSALTTLEQLRAQPGLLADQAAVVDETISAVRKVGKRGGGDTAVGK